MKKKEFIAQDLLSKMYQYGENLPEKLPPERQLAEEYGVSRFTIRKALEKLAAIGAVHMVQGAGIFINPGVGNNPLVYNSITEKKFNQISFRLINLHKRRPDNEEQQIFNLTADDFIWAFSRLRYIDNRKVQIENSRMPVSAFPDLTPKVIESSIQQYILSKGYRLSHSLTHYQAININKEQAELLGCKKGIAAMHILNRGILQDGSVYTFSDIVDIDYSCTYIIPFNQDNLKFRQS
ncbi:GntR family transcriptional regulator [Yersinia frederiksenii]|uniref:GntR family transcriptional regulator n=1 Tax=Yersinia alsatica TaxID=2890317 RepID=A0ABY5UP43_9GAMM|nr:GntR family transcriptional regulator [Yersinia alsatica]OVZ92986.1 GntR family transcriptional regulator [Yersinia frederiksenii]OWF70636.1 GntR family transcriptional regulator [Yersinia frederiksenii]OWF79709.1 GntR family transcriptional regulator [Yersinia frederiksenii]UWM43892.1 GntR family transcriptional regulator [Yersinia alsatica]CFQ57964.1 GntR family transcriptional regulator [Yersinia frederiksenii]